MINSDGLHTCVLATYELFDYLAYGDGEVGDNDTALANELGRNAVYEQVAYDDYFEVIATIGLNEVNGYSLTEFGLAVAAVGDISTTELNYPLVKNINYEVIVYSTIAFAGLI